MKKKRKKGKKVLVVVAHPDDETIWMGGTLLLNKKNWQTTIISLCRRGDKDRAPKFAEACRAYNAKSFISDLDDSEHGDFKKIKTDDIIKRIKKFIDGKTRKKYNFIFTHGSNGEYGHRRHIEVHNAVVKMIENKDLITEQIFFFSYQTTRAGCVARKNSDKFIKLKAIDLVKKKNLIKEVYGFRQGSFEEKSSESLEAFKLQ